MINLLLRQGRMTIAQLVEATGVTTTAIRQQVDRLVSEGWLAREGRAEAWADRDTSYTSRDSSWAGLPAANTDKYARTVRRQMGPTDRGSGCCWASRLARGDLR